MPPPDSVPADRQFAALLVALRTEIRQLRADQDKLRGELAALRAKLGA